MGRASARQVSLLCGELDEPVGAFLKRSSEGDGSFWCGAAESYGPSKTGDVLSMKDSA